MKTLKLISAVMLVIALAFTTNGVSAQKMARENVIEYVVKAINYPPDAVGQKLQGDVLVSFTIDPQGHLRVQEINGAPELRAYVYDQINAMQLPNDVANVDEPIALRFNFKLI
jgi:outer membrane biosynthesis protein TonB